MSKEQKAKLWKAAKRQAKKEYKSGFYGSPGLKKAERKALSLQLYAEKLRAAGLGTPLKNGGSGTPRAMASRSAKTSPFKRR